MLTKQQIEKALPAFLKSSATQGLTDLVNNASGDPLAQDVIRQNFISYTHVLKEGKFKTEDYFTSVMYVSYKLMGYNNQEAYFRTFPDRHARFLANNTSSKDIAAYVTSYHKGKLVNLIMEQALVPTWVLNQDLFQKALNVQAMLMTDPEVSPKTRSDAANSILTHLKKPEGKEFQISLDINETSGMTEMKQALEKMAQTQQDLIAAGMSTRQIAASPIIEGEIIENEIP